LEKKQKLRILRQLWASISCQQKEKKVIFQQVLPNLTPSPPMAIFFGPNQN
jgi:hypothetical protein